ncbi:MAG: hypothetical protein ACYCYP_12520 [Leptospirales bacterium]
MKNDEDLFAPAAWIRKTLHESPIARVGIGAGILFFVGMFSWAIEEHGWIKGFEAGIKKGAGGEMSAGGIVPSAPPLPEREAGVSSNPEYRRKIDLLNRERIVQAEKTGQSSVPEVGGEEKGMGLLPVPAHRLPKSFTGENVLSPHPPLAPPISGLDSPYLGTEQILRIDGENTSVIRCKSGYDSVLFFPGRKVRKIFLGGYSWTGATANTAEGGVVVVDPPFSFPVSSNLVVVFDSGVSFFRLKLVDSEQPFMARTVVRWVDGRKVSVRSKKVLRDPEDR